MFKRKISIPCILVFLVSLVLIFTGCDYQGNPNINQPPEVYITSFTGRDTPDEAGSLDAVVYQQKIYWYGKDVDGVIVGYAYRILTAAGDPISTAGNENISGFEAELVSVDPENKGGWVLHYKKGTSEDFPIYDDRSQTTVWTEQVFTDVNFPAADANGTLTERASSFEIVAIDNRGALSKPTRKYFFTKSDTPSILVSTSKGLLSDSIPADTPTVNTSVLGQGIRMIFTMSDQRIGIMVNKPWYFRYRIYRMAGDALYGDDDNTKWYTTQYLANTGEVVLNKSQTNGIPGYPIANAPHSTNDDEIWDWVPQLKSNFTNGSRHSYSVLDVQVVDLAGVYSQPVKKYFLVNDNYKPAAMLYPDRIYALGSNHYSPEDYMDTRWVTEPPKSYIDGAARIAQLLHPTPILDENNRISFEWQLFGDTLTKFWVRWGYNGEYPDNKPHSSKTEDIVKDASTGRNYGSEISHYYISLDDAPLPYTPLMVAGLQEHDYKNNYLQVPVHHEIAQLFVRSSFSPGDHTIKIRVKDLQDVVSEPDTFAFKMFPKVTANQRSGILYLDFATTRADSGNRQRITDFYTRIFTGYFQKGFTYMNRDDIFETRRTRYTKFHTWRTTENIFPITLLDKYEYVIIATELTSGNTDNIPGEVDGITSYIENGGKVILIGNQFLISYNFLREYFGFPPNSSDAITGLDFQYYFTGGIPDLPDTQIIRPETTSPRENGAVNTTLGALRSASVFTNETSLPPGSQVLYRFDSNLSPTDPDYQVFHNKPIGFKFTPNRTSQGTTFTFTVPFYHLQEEDVKHIFFTYIFW